MPRETLHRINHPQAPCPVPGGVPSTWGSPACTGSLGKMAGLSLAHTWKWGPRSLHSHRDPTHRPAQAPGSPAASASEVGLKWQHLALSPPPHHLGRSTLSGSTVDSWPCPDKWTKVVLLYLRASHVRPLVSFVSGG